MSNCSLNLSADQLKRIVDYTFKQVDTDSDDKISFEEYRQVLRRNPALLGSFKFELQE